jgi:hypothetical protein
MRLSIKSATLLFVFLLLVSCGVETPVPSATPVVSVTIQSGELVPQPITKDFTYDHCSFDVPMDMTITYGQVLSETFTKELDLQFGEDIGAGVPTVVEASIKVGVEERFSAEKKNVNETEQVASFTIPAHSFQVYTVTLIETLRAGELSFTYDGETHGAHYSYRVNLEGTGSISSSLPCAQGSATQPIVPSPTANDYCGDGFDHSIWTPVSTDEYFFPINTDSCWQLGNYGLTMSNGTISVLENNGGIKANWYGVTRPILPNADIRMTVHLEKFSGAQLWIGFLESPDKFTDGKFMRIKLADKSKPKYISAFDIVELMTEYPDYPMPRYDNIFDPNDTGTYSIHMKLDSNRLSIWLNNSPAKAFPVFELTQRYLFIGYLSSTQIDIDARIDSILVR